MEGSQPVLRRSLGLVQVVLYGVGMEVKTDVIIGYTSVAKSIVEYAEEHNMDLIVIGTRGMTGIKKMPLGSATTGVVTYAHCPVLIVRLLRLGITRSSLHFNQYANSVYIYRL